jgi:hypothetical protein
VCAATRSAFRKVEAIAPTVVAAHLDEGWLSSNSAYLARADLFFHIAAGSSPPDAADGLR